MIKYPISFQELVQESLEKSKQFCSETQETECNPHYLGFGNPSAQILLIGQEKAIPEGTSKIKVESRDNVAQWNEMIKRGITDPFYPFPDSTDFLNPFNPYEKKAKGNGTGQTWYFYQKLVQQVYPEITNSAIKNSFFEKAFISELNHTTSRTRRGYKPHLEREMIWGKRFFSDFPVVILATGDYISKKKIQELFSVTHKKNLSVPYKKLEIYKSPFRVLINTRQLSNGVSNELINRVAKNVKNSGKLAI